LTGVVENMSWFTPDLHKDEKYYLFGKDGGKRLAENFNSELLAQIPLIEGMCQSIDKGSFISFAENDIIKTEFKKIANKISSMIKI
jgi:ATP-binding protein involved in chromosome partitioning